MEPDQCRHRRHPRPFGNTNASLETSEAWPLVHPVLATLLLCVALTAIFAPLALARYRRITRG